MHGWAGAQHDTLGCNTKSRFTVFFVSFSVAPVSGKRQQMVNENDKKMTMSELAGTNKITEGSAKNEIRTSVEKL